MAGLNFLKGGGAADDMEAEPKADMKAEAKASGKKGGFPFPPKKGGKKTMRGGGKPFGRK